MIFLSFGALAGEASSCLAASSSFGRVLSTFCDLFQRFSERRLEIRKSLIIKHFLIVSARSGQLSTLVRQRYSHRSAAAVAR